MVSATDLSDPTVMRPQSASRLLDVRGLSLSFATIEGELPITKNVSFSIRPGERVGIVGSSAISSFGLQISAIAIITRWRISRPVAPKGASGPLPRLRKSAFPRRSAAATNIRTSCPGACASA